MSDHEGGVLMSYDQNHLAETFAKWVVENTFEYEVAIGALGDLRGKTVIDFGCGAGGFLTKCLERGANMCVGFDLSESMIQQANKDETKSYFQSIGKLRFRVADLFEPLDYAGEQQVDIATSQYVLHHCDCDSKLERYFANILMCLKPGGKLVLNMSPVVANLEEQEKVADVCRMVFPLKSGFERGDPFFEKLPVYYPMKYVRTGEVGPREPMFHFDNYQWSRDKLTRKLTEAGFVNVTSIDTKQLKFDRCEDAVQFESLEEPMIFLSAVKP